MKYTLLVSLLALFVPAFAQDDTESAPSEFAQTVLEALEGAGLTTLASAIGVLAATPAGEAFLEELEDGDKTVFAPTNEAFTSAGFPEDFAALSEEDAADLDLATLAQVLMYHVVDESVEESDIGVSPETTSVETLLMSSADDYEDDDEEGGASNSTETETEFNFPSNTSVPLVLTRESEESEGFQIFNNGEPIDVTSEAVEVENLRVYTIDTIIPLPSSLADVAESAGLTQLAEALTEYGLLEALNSSSGGLTIFAPNDAAFESIGGALEELDDDAIALILQNHVINGSVVLSDDIGDIDEDAEILPLAGPAFEFSTNDTGTFVTSGEATAQIIATDYLFNGGVVHVIDAVLVNEEPEVNPTPTGTGGGVGSPTGTDGSETSTPAGEDEDNGNGASSLQMSWGLGAAVVSFGAIIGGGLVAV